MSGCHASVVRRLAVTLLLLGLAGCGAAKPPGGTVWQLDPRTGRVEARTEAPGRACRLAFGQSAVWVTDLDPGAVYRFDRRAASLGGRKPCGVAVGPDAVWVGTAGGQVIRLPPVRAIDTGSRGGLGDLVVYGGFVWAAALDGAVVRVGRRVDRVPGIGETEQLAALDGAVWAIAAGPGELVRIDARTLKVRRFPIGPSPKALAAGDGAVWVALTDRRLLRFDPARERAELVARLPDAPILLAPAGGVVWSLAASGRLAKVDHGAARVARSFARKPFGLTTGGGALWVGTR
jgi:streptogramin lyase